MADVKLRKISKQFGTSSVLNSVTLNVVDGEFLTLIGPSGCGKSTLLRIISGLEAQNSGSVMIAGRSVDHLRPTQRKIAMVFQSYALYPHLSVARNIATPLEIDQFLLAERMPLLGLLSPRRRQVRARIDAAVQETAEILQIEPLLSRRPAQLSGGQRQRVALGRAMVRQPDVFLMDEPLSNLDAALRVHMRQELAALHAKLGATFIYVTHDQVEAMTMSDRVALMQAGDILQVGTPDELYHRPRNTQVAAFLGSPKINLLPGEIDSEGRVRLYGLGIGQVGPGAAVRVGLRPEAISLTAPGSVGAVEGQVTAREDLGHEAILQVAVAPSQSLTLRVAAADMARAQANGWMSAGVSLAIDPAQAMIFDAEGARLERRTAPSAAAAE